jgi:hypothetical protein
MIDDKKTIQNIVAYIIPYKKTSLLENKSNWMYSQQM